VKKLHSWQQLFVCHFVKGNASSSLSWTLNMLYIPPAAAMTAGNRWMVPANAAVPSSLTGDRTLLRIGSNSLAGGRSAAVAGHRLPQLLITPNRHPAISQGGGSSSCHTAE